VEPALTCHLYNLNRRLDRIIVTIPIGEPGRKLRKRMLANRTRLFVFMTNWAVPYTNNVSERHIRVRPKTSCTISVAYSDVG
jgi:hypothetical protein